MIVNKSCLMQRNRRAGIRQRPKGLPRKRRRGRVIGTQSLFHYFDKEPRLGIRGGDNPYNVFIARCGRCGEYSHLFAEMGRIAGLNISSVQCPGENHAWNEVYFDDNTTIIVDATEVKLPHSTGIMSPEFMQKKVANEWRKQGKNLIDGNISYVYYKLPNDNKKYDTTFRYTNTTNITVNITDSKGFPVPNVRVKLISYNRKDWIDKNGIGTEKKSNNSGQCTFIIGGGNYRISIQKDGDIRPTETDIFELWENSEDRYYNLEYKSQTLIDIILGNLLELAFITVFSILFLLFIYFLGRKTRPGNKK